MSLINRHDRCIGLRLWRSKNYFIQLWYCPPHTKLKPHRHPNQDNLIVFLLGSAWFFRGQIARRAKPFTYEALWLTPFHIFRHFTIHFFHVHWLETKRSPVLFLNIGVRIGVPLVSAAIDLDYEDINI